MYPVCYHSIKRVFYPDMGDRYGCMVTIVAKLGGYNC